MSLEDKIVFTIIVVFLMFCTWCLVSCCLADGSVDFCYVVPKINTKNEEVSYILKGHVPWRPDREIQINLVSLEDAIGKAEQISCEIR